MNVMIKMISSILLVIGGLNWGLVGILDFDLVAWLCGGSGTILARVIYALVGLAAITFAIASLASHNRDSE